MSTNIEQFSYVSKRVALTHLYVELSLPLPAALRAAEADLRQFGSYKRSSRTSRAIAKRRREGVTQDA